MLKPEEIKAKMMLKKITSSEIATKSNLSRGHISIIINYGPVVVPLIAELIGENPFDYQVKKKSKKKKADK